MTDAPHFRSSPRPQVACQVEIIPLEMSAKPIVTFTKDLSNGGLFLVCNREFEIGEKVKLKLSTPSTWQPIVLLAKVVWKKEAQPGEPAGIGFHFLELSDDQIIALNSFVSSLEYEG